ncbi:hypothetical protein LTR10_009229 [Elasticomyces elasticus]|nr:hypothetical protein LTR10_009229 [Elasticomyces elasticus]KAK4971671.1 hypothetical protein LTR42_007399 [Elasticomyces elasticus]
MSHSDPSFHLFLELPLELREEIWRYCLPHRVRELDTPLAQNVFEPEYEYGSLLPCNLQGTTFANGLPPVLTRVCLESRKVARETGALQLPASSETADLVWEADSLRKQDWEDRARESVHLHWTYIYGADFESSGRPLDYLVRRAVSVAAGSSFMAKYIDSRFDWAGEAARASETEQTLQPETLRDLEALRKLPSLQVVVRVIVVHCDFKSAAKSGLFGLLGDALVQIVDVRDDNRVVDRYLAFAEACEQQGSIAVNQDFRRELVAVTRRKLKDLIMGTYGCPILAATARPAIMFRLCTKTCNQLPVRSRQAERGGRRTRYPRGSRGL